MTLDKERKKKRHEDWQLDYRWLGVGGCCSVDRLVAVAGLKNHASAHRLVGPADKDGCARSRTVDHPACGSPRFDSGLDTCGTEVCPSCQHNNDEVKKEKTIMKKALFVLAFVILMSGMSSWAGGGANPESIADEFVKLDVIQYEGAFGYTLLSPAGERTYHQGELAMQLNGGISREILDGKDVTDPSGGFVTEGEGSITDFWVQVNGWDGVSSRYATYGFASDNLLLPDEGIGIEVKLSHREAFVAFDAEGYDSTRLELWIGGSRFGYDVSRGGFNVWYNPATAGEYSIMNISTGETIALGSIGEGLVEANLFNLRMEGGVRELFSFGQSDAFLQNQWFSSSLDRDGVWVPAQLYTVRTYGSALTLEASGAVARVEVYSLDGDERVLVAELDLPIPIPVGKGGPIQQLNVPAGFDRLVVELIGDPDNWGNFTLWAYKGPGGRG